MPRVTIDLDEREYLQAIKVKDELDLTWRELVMFSLGAQRVRQRPIGRPATSDKLYDLYKPLADRAEAQYARRFETDFDKYDYPEQALYDEPLDAIRAQDEKLKAIEDEARSRWVAFLTKRNAQINRTYGTW